MCFARMGLMVALEAGHVRNDGSDVITCASTRFHAFTLPKNAFTSVSLGPRDASRIASIGVHVKIIIYHVAKKIIF